MRAVLLIALALLSVLAPAAGATLPGRNGDILLAENTRHHAGPWGESNLLRISPRTGALTRTPICAMPLSPGPHTPACSAIGPPAASPDGSSVAFTSDGIVGDPFRTPATFGLRVLSLETGTTRYLQLPGRSGSFAAPVHWMPDLSFAFGSAGNQVLLAGPDGSDRGKLVANASAPDVTSRGRVVFVRGGNLHLLKPDGKTRQLTRKGGDQPSWSPGGRVIAFERPGGIGRERKSFVYTVGVGGGAHRITRGFGAVWSPDGRQIAFLRYAKPGYGDEAAFLYTWNRRTGHIRRVGSEVFGVPEPVLANSLDWEAVP
jgi:Tol biopolymer transport system component